MGDRPFVVLIWHLQNVMDNRPKLSQTAKWGNERLKADERRLHKELLERAEIEEDDKADSHPVPDRFKAYTIGDHYVMYQIAK